MSIGLLFPAALTALAALLIPIVLHLARRNQLKQVDFSALRWLHAKPRPRQRLRFEDIPLLLLRLFLLALLVLWLAQPVLRDWHSTSTYVAVMPGITPAQVAAQAFPERARLHWLAPLFPPIDKPLTTTAVPVASLLRQLDAELPGDVPIIVLASAVFDGADAQRPQLSRAVEWRVLKTSAPSVSEKTSAITAPTLHIVTAPSQPAEAHVLQAVAQAWHASATGFVLVDEDAARSTTTWPNASQTVVVWLSHTTMPDTLLDWVKHGGTALLSSSTPFAEANTMQPRWYASDGRVLLVSQRLGAGSIHRLTQVLTPQALPETLDAAFPNLLLSLLQPNSPQAQRADALQYQPELGKQRYTQAPEDIQPWFALLAALLFALERWLATRKPVGGEA